MNPYGEAAQQPDGAEAAIELALARARTQWQSSVIREWRARHPKIEGRDLGSLGTIYLVPIPCSCTKCGTPAMIFPGDRLDRMPDAQGYCICPKCSVPQAKAVSA